MANMNGQVNRYIFSTSIQVNGFKSWLVSVRSFILSLISIANRSHRVDHRAAGEDSS